MKRNLFIATLLLIFGIQTAQARVKIPIPIGEEQKIEKVADLPDNENYLVDGHHIDLGQMYSVYTIVWIPVWVTKEPQLVAFSTSKPNEYYSLDENPELKQEILKENNLEEDDLLSVGFFTRYGGKLIFLVIIGLIIYGWIPSKN